MDSDNCNKKNSRSVCIFCWNHLSRDSTITTEVDCIELEKYLTLFERYLQSLNKIEKRLRIPELVNKKSDLIGTCGKCGEILKEFSKLFHELKCIELKLNWKIDSLKMTVENANRKNHSLKCSVFKDKERVDGLLEFQNNFVKKCSLHFKQSYPKLTMKRCRRSNENENAKREQGAGIVPLSSQDYGPLTLISNVTTRTETNCRHNCDERGNENKNEVKPTETKKSVKSKRRSFVSKLKRKKRPKVPAFRIPELEEFDLVDRPGTTSAPSIILFGTQHGLELDKPASHTSTEETSPTLNSQVDHAAKNTTNSQQLMDAELARNEVPNGHVHIPSMIESIIRNNLVEPQLVTVHAKQSLQTSPSPHNEPANKQEQQGTGNYLPRPQAQAQFPKNNVTCLELGNDSATSNFKSESQPILFDNDDNDSMCMDTDAADPLGDCDLPDRNSNYDTAETENETKAEMCAMSKEMLSSATTTEPTIADRNLSPSNIEITASSEVSDRNCENEISISETTLHESKTFLMTQLAKPTTTKVKESTSSRQTSLHDYFRVASSTQKNDNNNSVTNSGNPINSTSSVSIPIMENESASRFRRRFKCSECTLTFTSAGSLESHLSSVHVQIEDCTENDGKSEPEIGDRDDDAFSIEEEEDDEHDDDDPMKSESDSDFDINEEREFDEEFEEKPLKSELDSGDDHDESEIEENKNVNRKRHRRKKGDSEIVRDLQCGKCEPWSNESDVPWHVHVAKHRYLHTKGQEQLRDNNPEHLNIKWSDLKVEIDGNVVELKEEFTAPGCGRKFALEEQFDYHLRLHGNFQCAKANCKTTTCCLMDLVEHESTKHRSKNGSESYDRKNIKCGRCEFRTERAQALFRHYLAAHSDDIVESRAFEQYRCSICKYLFRLGTGCFPMLHFLNWHDLSRIDDPSKVHRCEVSDCPAYFLTPMQLKFHTLQHSPATVKSPTSLKPKQTRILLNNTIRWTKITEDGLTVESFVLKRGAKFKCDEASCKNSKFFTKEEMEIHQKLHGKFKCNFCETVETYAPNLSRHELQAHSKCGNDKYDNDTEEVKGNMLDCPICPRKLRGRVRYIMHHLEKHLGLVTDTPRCLICGLLYQATGKKDLMISIFKHYTEQHDLSAALDTSAGDKLWRCEKENCKAYFLSRLQLFNHVRVIHCLKSQMDRKKKQSSECLECGRVFKLRILMSKHMLKCHPEAFLKFFPFSCPIDGCTRRCETERILKQHLIVSHPNQSDQHLCPICGRRFKLLWSLKSHLTSHDEEQQMRVEETKKRWKTKRDFVCDQCGSKFNDKYKLETHKMSHSGQDSWTFVCEICSKKCLTKQKLEEHLRTHTKEKPFKCDHCGVSYAHRHNWRIHVQTKHGVEDVTTRVYKKVNVRIKANTNVGDAQKKKIVRKRKKKDWEEEEEFSTGESDSSD